MTEIIFGWVLPAIHVIACFFLVSVVLLQRGKGADMGAIFGGASQTFFGASGAGNLLTRLTTAAAIIFMSTSLLMTYGQSRFATPDLLKRLPDVAAEAPATPQTGAAPAAPAAEGAPAATDTAPAETPPAP